MFELKKYHGDKVQSLTYEDNQENFSVGIITPGDYHFGSLKNERNIVIHGVISVWIEGDDEWKVYTEGKSFSIPVSKNFRFKVDQTSSYICYYS